METSEPWCGPSSLRFHHGARFLAPVELVRDDLLSLSLFDRDVFAIPLLETGFDRVHMEGERVTVQGRVVVDEAPRTLTAWLTWREPLSMTLRGVLRDPGGGWWGPEEPEGRRWARTFYHLEGRRGVWGTEVAVRFELEPVRLLSRTLRQRLERELRGRFHGTTVRALERLRGRVEREITAPHPKPFSAPAAPARGEAPRAPGPGLTGPGHARGGVKSAPAALAGQPTSTTKRLR